MQHRDPIGNNTPKRRQRINWDEAKLKKIEEEKKASPYGTMAIDEPETPFPSNANLPIVNFAPASNFHTPSILGSPTKSALRSPTSRSINSSENKTSSSPRTTPSQLRFNLNIDTPLTPRTPEQEAEFKRKRSQHYDEYLYLKSVRQGVHYKQKQFIQAKKQLYSAHSADILDRGGLGRRDRSPSLQQMIQLASPHQYQQLSATYGGSPLGQFFITSPPLILSPYRSPTQRVHQGFQKKKYQQQTPTPQHFNNNKQSINGSTNTPPLHSPLFKKETANTTRAYYRGGQTLMEKDFDNEGNNEEEEDEQ
ncbi:MAG: hypothetical protein EZS28_032287 [Streblomastix strix]|uniref:Uncharacterized protein n=1 Tax=Streblomastix strix TaxID=222440 RepID=A0A5J4UP26_9EUKA|nr:MAG: hypothetical protein EZS28_032287 [Streblomastix strix]